MQEQDARGRGVDLDVADPVDGAFHRGARMEVAQVGVADQQAVGAAVQVERVDAVVGRRVGHRRGRVFAVADGLVRDVEPAVVHAQRVAAVGGGDVDRQRQVARLAGDEVVDRRAESGIEAAIVVAPAVVDQLRLGLAVQPLQLAAHLPVPGGGGADGVVALAVAQVEVADLGAQPGREHGVLDRRAVGQQIAAAAMPDGLVVVAEEMMARRAAQAAAGDGGSGHAIHQ